MSPHRYYQGAVDNKGKFQGFGVALTPEKAIERVEERGLKCYGYLFCVLKQKANPFFPKIIR